MKYTVLGFNQTQAIQKDLDITDLIILRYFIDFKDTGKMSTTIENERVYYWFKYDGFIKEYPILSIKKDAVYRRMKVLIEKGFLIHTTIKIGGTYSYYNIDKNILCLLSDSEPQGYGFQTVGVTDSEPQGGTVLVPEQNNPSTKINPSIKNNPFIDIPYSEIIDYLNLKATTKYKSTGKKTKDLIKARFNEKFTLDDFKTVIDKKCNEWLGTDFENYLRPETLFSNKFEGYLNQKEVKKNGTTSKYNKQSKDYRQSTGLEEGIGFNIRDL